MKQKRKALLGLAVLLCAAALLAGIYLTFRPQTVEGAKTVTVEVIAGGETVQTPLTPRRSPTAITSN